MKFFRTFTTILFFAGLLAVNPASAADTTQTYRQWIQDMQDADRGPFSRLRWFCADGTITPPKPYGCGDHGGGVQHGEWSKQTKILRDQGYYIANMLAALSPKDAQAWIKQPGFNDQFNQLLIERFLINDNDGWIFRKAQFYRGAIQEEDQRKGARTLLVTMLGEEQWYNNRFAATRIGSSLLAHGEDTASVRKVRELAVSIANKDSGFKHLRAKIHGAPDATDAERVAQYAKTDGKAKLQPQYQALIAEINRVYTAKPLADTLNAAADQYSKGPWLQEMLRAHATDYSRDDQAQNRYRVTAALLADIRDAMPRIHTAGARLSLMDLSLVVESENFKSGTELLKSKSSASRSQRLVWLSSAIDAAYGTGLINPRLKQAALETLESPDTGSIPLQLYLENLKYLARAPGWASQGLRYQFYESMQKLAEIEPLAMHFIQDQLRGSSLLTYSQLLNDLSEDANQLAGVKHRLFGKEIGSGFHALNPGLARGKLYTHANLEDIENFDTHGIYVLPETISDLPPLAGIITAGEGNPLSHVQLLARNLGIPNVTVDESLIATLKQHEGEMVVLAISPSGLVELNADNEHWQAMFKQNAGQNVVIRPDLEKLDISVREFISLDDLRASDSGRIVGPKAAKLGELRHHFPGMVAPGVGIPFGVFRETVLDKPYKNSASTVYEWMVAEYGKIRSLPAESREQKQYAESFRAELHQIILDAPLDEKFQSALRKAMHQAFGDLEQIGVFVRSDTNVEDLPGFTGAGLNLTLPNVIGFDNVVKSINKVWASPFTRRAFAWRQSHMEEPQYVYPAVLLLQSVPNEKSGVMVTEDIDSGDRNTISVAVNEGVGGAVDGQSAESLRINMHDGSVKVLATATAPWKRLPSRNGGILKLPTSGSWTVLQPGEIKQMIQFGIDLPKRFPAITDDEGNSAPADVEFGFLDGEMHLFQLRPFLQSREAQNNSYLINMDKALEGHLKARVNLNEVPQ